MRSLWRLAPIALAALIWWASSRPGAALPALPFVHADKVVHLLVFAALGGAVVRGWRWPWLAGALVAAAYGAVDEWHQAGVPGRSASGADALADALGAGLGAWLARRRP